MLETLIIRADGSAKIGAGHVMRCLALARRWQQDGGRVLFVQAATTPSLDACLRAAGAETVMIEAELGGSADTEETIRHARASAARWIVADGYHFGAPWQKRIKEAGYRLLIIDDYGHAGHDHADVILNQNAGASRYLYANRDAHTQLLLGSAFALLRPEFLGWRNAPREVAPVATKVLVTLGGGDPDNVTSTVVAALDQLPGLEVVVVVGGSNPHREAVQSALEQHGGAMRLVVNATNMPELMAWADLAVSAAGSTSWELAFMGVPAALIVVADNQAGIATALAEKGVSLNLGRHQKLTAGGIAEALTLLIADGPRRQEMSRGARSLIDGHGVARVVAALRPQLRVTLLTDTTSWLNAYLPELKQEFEQSGHQVCWIHDPAELSEGDVAFFLSLSRIVPGVALGRHAHNLVVHESAVPHGRGWSPLTWQVLEGKNEIPVTLLEAVDGVDCGDIFTQTMIHFRGDELVEELRAAQAAATIALCRAFITRYPFSLEAARPQSGEASHYPRRRPADSRLDPDKTLREQFQLLRVSDPVRYPAYFEMAGRRYEVRISVAP